MARRAVAYTQSEAPEGLDGAQPRPAAVRLVGLDIPDPPAMGARALQAMLAANLSQGADQQDERWSRRRSVGFAVFSAGALWAGLAVGAILLRG